MFNSPNAFWAFERSVTRSTRFIFDEHTRSFLDAVVATSKSRLRILRSGHVLYRAQLGETTRDDEEYGVRIPEAYLPSRMTPLIDRAVEGRINPKGIPYLYLSFDPNTSMAELRPWVGARISLGEFVVSADCTILDCSLDATNLACMEIDDASALSAEDREAAVWGK